MKAKQSLFILRCSLVCCISSLCFSTPSLSRFLKLGVNIDELTKKSDEYVIEVEFESSEEENDESKENEEKRRGACREEEKPDEEDLIKEKKNVFVDTSDKATDEVPQVETNKIGEKGSIARDKYTGKDNINNSPRLTDEPKLITRPPDELVAVKPSQVGFPEESSSSNPAEDAAKEQLQTMAEQEEVVGQPDVDNTEVVQTEVETALEPVDELFVKEEELEESKIPPPPVPEVEVVDHETELIDGIEKDVEEVDEEEEIVEEEPEELEPTMYAFEPKETKPKVEPIENTETEKETEVKEESIEKIAEAVKEYKEVASVSMEKIKEIVESREANDSNINVQETIPQGSVSE